MPSSIGKLFFQRSKGQDKLAHGIALGEKGDGSLKLSNPQSDALG